MVLTARLEIEKKMEEQGYFSDQYREAAKKFQAAGFSREFQRYLVPMPFRYGPPASPIICVRYYLCLEKAPAGLKVEYLPGSKRKPKATKPGFAPLTDEEIGGWWDITTHGFKTDALSQDFIGINQRTQSRLMWEGTIERINQGKVKPAVNINHDRAGDYHGFIDELRIKGDKLQARFLDLAPWLRDALRRGLIRGRSAEWKIVSLRPGLKETEADREYHKQHTRFWGLAFCDGVEAGDRSLNNRPTID